MQDDAMVGSWAKNKNGQLIAYEILTMREIEGEIIYRFDYYKKPKVSDIFAVDSTTRLKLMITAKDQAIFTIIGEENWQLTMPVKNDVLSGYMGDLNKPDAERLYSYVATRQEP